MFPLWTHWSHQSRLQSRNSRQWRTPKLEPCLHPTCGIPSKCWRVARHCSTEHSWLWTSPLRSALTTAGIACSNAATHNGAVLHCALQDKEAKYFWNSWKVAGVTSLSALWRRAGDGATKRSPLLTALLQHGLAQLFLFSEDPRIGHGAKRGSWCWRSLAPGRLPCWYADGHGRSDSRHGWLVWWVMSARCSALQWELRLTSLISRYLQNKCFRCGRMGHIRADCRAGTLRQREKCRWTRGRRNGDLTKMCHWGQWSWGPSRCCQTMVMRRRRMANPSTKPQKWCHRCHLVCGFRGQRRFAKKKLETFMMVRRSNPACRQHTSGTNPDSIVHVANPGRFLIGLLEMNSSGSDWLQNIYKGRNETRCPASNTRRRTREVLELVCVHTLRLRVAHAGRLAVVPSSRRVTTFFWKFVASRAFFFVPS